MSNDHWRESERFKERVRAAQEPDNFHQVHLPQVFDVGALTYLLESKGIAPLVWGEMAAYAYHSRTVPTKLFFIIRDNLFGLAIDTLTRAGLERKTTFCRGGVWGEEEALHKPYVRFRLRQHWPGELIHTYLQLFSASEVGLSVDSRAWEDSRTFSVVDSRHPSPAVLRHFGLRPKLHYGFLVTSQADYFAIALHLIHMTLTGGFEDRDVVETLMRLKSMVSDVFQTADGSPLEFADIYVPEKYAELAFLLFTGLPTFLPAIEERDPRGIRLRRNRMRWGPTRGCT